MIGRASGGGVLSGAGHVETIGNGRGYRVFGSEGCLPRFRLLWRRQSASGSARELMGRVGEFRFSSCYRRPIDPKHPELGKTEVPGGTLVHPHDLPSRYAVASAVIKNTKQRYILEQYGDDPVRPVNAWLGVFLQIAGPEMVDFYADRRLSGAEWEAHPEFAWYPRLGGRRV